MRVHVGRISVTSFGGRGSFATCRLLKAGGPLAPYLWSCVPVARLISPTARPLKERFSLCLFSSLSSSLAFHFAISLSTAAFVATSRPSASSSPFVSALPLKELCVSAMITVDHRISELCAFALVTGLEGTVLFWVLGFVGSFLAQVSRRVLRESYWHKARAGIAIRQLREHGPSSGSTMPTVSKGAENEGHPESK